MLQKFLVKIIRLYQITISPDHGFFSWRHPDGWCQFHPTCSSYSLQAIKRYGAGRGIIFSAKRIFRCHPWSRGGYDPVPKSNQQIDQN
ncbi:membrane protein insertion efficiency factor YidD [Patescibacteria group bacterium]